MKCITHLFHHRHLVVQLLKRELAARYRRSLLGPAWLILSPLLQLGLYSLVFGVVIRLRWHRAGAESLGSYALILFCGLGVYSMLVIEP